MLKLRIFTFKRAWQFGHKVKKRIINRYQSIMSESHTLFLLAFVFINIIIFFDIYKTDSR